MDCLGFKKVGAIFDGDKENEFKVFQEEFQNKGFKSWIIPADDIRDKEKYETQSKNGLLKKDRKTIKPEYVDDLKEMFKEIGEYMNH